MINPIKHLKKHIVIEFSSFDKYLTPDAINAAVKVLPIVNETINK